MSSGSYYNADAVLQESYTYDTYTYQSPNAGSQTIYVLASDTVYANSDGTGAEATSYTYTWYANSPQEKTVVTTLPVVSYHPERQRPDGPDGQFLRLRGQSYVVEGRRWLPDPEPIRRDHRAC